jgi:hypothetical protein
MTFREFYSQEYLPRHANRACRAFHLLGLLAGVAYVGVVLWLGVWWLLALFPLPIYLLAFTGHLLVPNLPTTFEHPVWSFAAYWKMITGMLTGGG